MALDAHPWEREPDFRRHEKPIQLTGTVTAEGLRAGTRYSFQINLWHSRPLSAEPELADRARSPR